jgi:hypothetical protein
MSSAEVDYETYVQFMYSSAAFHLQGLFLRVRSYLRAPATL